MKGDLMPTPSFNLRAARKARKWTQSELAQHAGLAVSTIVNAEKEGASPRAFTLRAIEKALIATPVTA
jgi:transcriptional regulator with XRE-family HTH domain